MSKKNYIALCAIAIGKQIISAEQPLPDGVNAEKIKSLLANGSIKEADGEPTATLTGVVTKDGRVVELNKLSAAALKKIAIDLEVAGADQMKKDALIEAITAIEFAVPEEE
jgi:hypothetical protein